MSRPRIPLPGRRAALAASVLLLAGASGAHDAPAPVPEAFADGALAEPVTTVDCTLSDGREASCYRIVTAGTPAGATVGPFCPRTIEDTAESVGIWLDGGTEVYDVDGDFIVGLPELYDDPEWQLYDPATGEVNVTDTLEGCEAAARPDVDPAYRNYCVECSLDYVDGGVSATFLIPVEPVMADAPTRAGADVGVSLNGVVIAASAPVEDILGNYTIAAFDDCGGHINPFEGYHYHAATECNTGAAGDDGHAGLVGYALDGYPIYGQIEDVGEHAALDDCRGATDEVRGYHYHAADASRNLIVGCFSGLTEASANEGPGGGPPPGDGPPPGGGPRPDDRG